MARFSEVFRCSGVDEGPKVPGRVVATSGGNLVALEGGERLRVHSFPGALVQAGAARKAEAKLQVVSLILDRAEVRRWLCKAHTASYRNVAPSCSMMLTIVGLGTLLYSIACFSPPPNWPAYLPRGAPAAPATRSAFDWVHTVESLASP
jgi:hypothetical protein